VPSDFDALLTVRDAAAIVCEVEADSLTSTTRFADLGADSLARVCIADVVEASIRASHHETLQIDDASLGRVDTLGELADFITGALGAPVAAH
jgi:acyl carrier protein